MSRQAAILTATFLISACAIGYEILLMRVLSIVQWHHFAYMIISLALLGYGASGTFIALTRRRLEGRVATAFSVCASAAAAGMVLAFVVGQRVPFNALEIVWDPRQFLHLGVIYLVFFVPFFFAATCIGLALTFLKGHISRVYFLDLCGAAVGAALVVGAMFVLPLQAVLLLLSGLALAAALVAAAGSDAGSRLLAANALLLFLMLFALPAAWLELRMSPYKPLSQALHVIGARVLDERSSPLGLLTVVASPEVPFRNAPGLSLNSPHVPPEQLGLFTDGGGMSTITRFDGDFDDLGYLGDLTASLPYRLLEQPHVLVLGAGGGTDVLMALFHGASRVDAVELDPGVIELVRKRYGDFTGALYDHERVRVHTAEARGFMARSPSRFDLIQLSLADASATAGSGIQGLSENYAYTVEAFQSCLAHLAPGGFLAVTRWISMPPRGNLKLLATAAEALRGRGVTNPERRIAMIRNWNTATLLVGSSELTPATIEAIRAFAARRSFDTVWYPGMPADEANRFNRLPEPWLYEGARAVTGPEAEAFLDRYKFHIEPATDDKPYFSHFFRWRAFEEIMSLRARGGAGLVEWGYLLLVGTVVQAGLAGVILILLPLAAGRAGRRAGRKRMGAYFFLLGLSFMFIEIAFIQKFILFLSHPIYAVAVVLTGFLAFAGVGSAFAPRFESWAARHRLRAIDGAIFGIVLVTTLYLALLPPVFEALIALPDAARIPVALVLLAPLAFFLGMPLPLGLARTASQLPGFVPWAWGLNGFASVLSAALATLLAIELGFNAVMALALVLYVLAAACSRVWGTRRAGSQRA